MPAAPEATACAERLMSLAEDVRFADRSDDLRSLAEDLDREESDAWVAVDLFAAFPLDSTVRLEHDNWTERSLGMLTGVAVFLPVGWTWWSFREASSAYQDMLDAGQVEDGTTFLELWATGFENTLGHWHQLVPMALISTLLIIGAIAALVAHRVAAGVNVRREDDARRAAQTQLVSALTGASIVLNAKRADHPQRIEEVLQRSVDKLASAHRAVRKTLVEVDKATRGATEGLSSVSENLRDAAGEVSDLVVTATRASEATAVAADQTRQASLEGTAAITTVVQQSLEGLSDVNAQAVAAVTDSVQQGHASVTVALREGVTTISDASRESATVIAASVSSAEAGFRDTTSLAIRNAADDLQSVIGTMGSSATKTSDAAVSLASEVSKIGESQLRGQQDLADVAMQITAAVEQLDLALTRQEGALQGQVSELSAARDAAERMLRRLSIVAEPVGGR